MNWTIIIMLGFVLLFQLMILAAIVKLYEIFDMSAEILKRQADSGCAECGAKWRAGVHGRFVQHTEWCKKNPRWIQKGGTA